jgi:hypothetical protein
VELDHEYVGSYNDKAIEEFALNDGESTRLNKGLQNPNLDWK